MIIYVTGGARSGKSTFAQQLALNHSERPLYLATARTIDDDFEARIKKHREDRGNGWDTIEEEKHLSNCPLANRVVVIDCVTLWISNFYFDNNEDVPLSYQQVVEEVDKLVQMEAMLIFVSNEIGMGVHADSSTTRKFVDLQGWVNQYIAQQSDEAYFLVSGLSQRIK